ncbi:uncharacterized protein V1516DRAFT_711869 [Lipomyces oligophaga]|uniref:uncharacterized protein n=1 Tax=Lipomyces oligophaga TaxID=45792 RepID=UPI0034CF0F37
MPLNTFSAASSSRADSTHASSSSSSPSSSATSRAHSFPAALTHVISRQIHSASQRELKDIAGVLPTSSSTDSTGVLRSSTVRSTRRDKQRANSASHLSRNSSTRIASSSSSSAHSLLITGLCMCCMSSLRYPTSVPCFRCTVCQTTNDVNPLPVKRLPIIDSAYLHSLPSSSSLSSSDLSDFLDRISLVFQSFDALNRSFSNSKGFSYSETGIDFSALTFFYRYVLSCPTDEPMTLLLKYTESLLKRPGRILSSPDDLRVLLIIFENPVLYSVRNINASQTNHSAIIKRLCGLISGLNAACHHYLVNWFARLSTSSFKAKVELVNSFTSHRLSKYCTSRLGGAKLEQYGQDWRIRAAARTLSLFFAANIQVSKIPASCFYNTMVDYIDITHDFDRWEKQGIAPPSTAPISRLSTLIPAGNQVGATGSKSLASQAKSSHLISDSQSSSSSVGSLSTVGGSSTLFTFCQYPFFLSMGSKITILEYDARRQMEIKAREAFFSTLNYKRVVHPHLVLKVRRDCIIEDSLNQISSNEMELKKGLKIEFVGEDGVDAGGLRKEWFLLLVRELFDPLNGMFTYDEESNYCWFNHSTFETSDQYYLVGVVLGLAMYNSTILDIQLPRALFKKLLGCPCTLADLMILKPSLAKGLQKLLDFNGNVEETFCRDFVAEHEIYGTVVQVPLMPGGENRAVTNGNRQEFVNKYIQFIFDVSVSRQFQPFKRGFYHVIGGNALTLFRPEEIELLVRGSDEGLDVAALRAVAIYDGWGSNGSSHGDPHGSNTNSTNTGKNSMDEVESKEQVVVWFWEYFERMDVAQQRKLLTFVTGSDRIPATGIANLIFKISRLGDDSDRYPISHTCFNQLCLYRYSSREKLEEKLGRAIEESQGFGLR